jgi:hypothetical protein
MQRVSATINIIHKNIFNLLANYINKYYATCSIKKAKGVNKNKKTMVTLTAYGKL